MSAGATWNSALIVLMFVLKFSKEILNIIKLVFGFRCPECPPPVPAVQIIGMPPLQQATAESVLAAQKAIAGELRNTNLDTAAVL